MTVQELILSDVDQIPEQKIKNMVLLILNSLLDYGYKDLFTKPASTSGKYHPEETRLEGGLAVHTHYVFNAAKVLLDSFQTEKSKRDVSIILAAAILHDALKCGIDWANHTVSDHPKLMAEYITQFAYKRYYLRKCPQYDSLDAACQIASLVREHMGKWGGSPTSDWRSLILHQADMIASRLHIIRDNPDIEGQVSVL